MKGIKFGNYHSYEDLKLVLTAKEIGTPSVKERKIEIEGADGFLDLTDFFGGEPKYENVTHRFDFSTIVPQSEFLSLFSSIKNALHGKKMRIILDGDPLFYYIGRINVLQFTNEKSIGNISIECDCEPYKYKLNKTVVSQTISETAIVKLTNSRKRAVPTITATNAFTIYHEGNAYSIALGTTTIPELEFQKGINDIAVKGTGTISFAWNEGCL
jgi:hypothetical protein